MVEFVDEHFLVLILGVAAVLTAVWLYLMRNRLKTNLVIVILLSILHVIVGVGSVKLFAFLEGFGKEYNGAMSLFGAVFFMPFAYALGAKLTKRSMRDVFDIFTIPLVFTLLLSRINCLHAGCCYGLPIHGTSLRYPTREAEIIFYLVFMIIEVPKVYKGKNSSHMMIKAESSTPGYIFVPVTWDRGWRAKVNGHQVKLYRADIGFQRYLILQLFDL